VVEAFGGGTYAYPFAATGRKEITAGELSALLEGIDLSEKHAVLARPRFEASMA
jgi:hypothetical protein